MAFPANTYVVLDIPSPVAERVLALREGQRDLFRWSLPAETTMSGSSGTGPIATDEDPQHVFAVIDAIAAETPPIIASFGPVRRFPDSDVFYLSFVDERPFRELHSRLASSGLRFEAVPFPFEPHCTLRTRSPISDDEVSELMAARVDSEFVLEQLSLYELPARATRHERFTTLLCLLHRVRLGGPG